MKDSDIYKLLRNFREEDFKNFDLFLKSPFHNKNKALIGIFQILNKKRNLIITKDNDKILNKLISGTGFSAATIKKLLSFMSDSVLEYYRIKAVKSDEINLANKLNEYLLANGDYDILDKELKKLDKFFKDSEKYGNSLIYNRFLHTNNVHNSNVARDKYINLKSTNFRLGLLKSEFEYIVLYTIIRITVLYVNYMNDIIENNSYHDIRNFHDPGKIFYIFEKEISGTDDESIRSVFELFKAAYDCYSNMSDKNKYTKYKNTFLSMIQKLDDETRYINFNILLGFASLSQRHADKDKFFCNEELELLELILKNRLYKSEVAKDLSPITYGNFVGLCVEMHDTEKLLWLISNLTDELNISIRIDMVNYAYAFYYYEKKDFRKALKHLNSTNLYKGLHKYELMNLEIKIYFEINDLNSLDKLLHNYRETVKKDISLTKLDKLRFTIFFKHMREMLRIINNRNTDSGSGLEYLLYKVKNENSFVMRKWLTAQIVLKAASAKKTKSSQISV